MRASVVADQQRVALRVVARALGPRLHPDQTTIGVLAAPGRNTLRGACGRGVAAEMDHLRAGIGLLTVVRDRDRVEFANRIVAFENAARVFPRDRRAGLDLGPRDLRPCAAASAALRDEIIDAAPALGVSGIPV